MVGIVAQAAVLGGVALGVTRGLGLDAAPWALGLGGLALAGAFEVGVQRARAGRLAELKPLFRSLIEGVGEQGEPRVTWSRGLPCLQVRAQWPYAVHLESVGSRLRICLTMAVRPAATGWLVSRHPQDYPHRLEQRLASRLTRLSVDDSTLCALSAEPTEAEALWARPGVLAAVRGWLQADAPRAATLELGREDVRWDVALHAGVTANRLISLAGSLPSLVEVEAEAVAEGVEGSETTPPGEG